MLGTGPPSEMEAISSRMYAVNVGLAHACLLQLPRDPHDVLEVRAALIHESLQLRLAGQRLVERGAPGQHRLENRGP